MICDLSRRDLLKGAVLAPVAGRLGGPRAAAAQEPTPEGGVVREHWIAVRNRRWSISPTKRDDWKGRAVKNVRFDALTYVATEPGFGRPLPRGGVGDNTGIPGPTLRAHPGDELVVHFRNEDKLHRHAHTIHPHGVRYEPRYDGTFMGRYTPPGGKVGYGKTYTYRWQVVEDSVGVWPYHDHGPQEHHSTEAGMFGAIVVTPRDEPPADVESTIYFHQLNPETTGHDRSLSAINGRAYAGNTPTVRAKQGQRVAWNVLTLGSEFHTFHIHGHRWRSPARHSVDAPIFGSSEGLRAEFSEDAPGRWLYHCHVMEHMMMGMVGYYVVS